MGSVFDDWDREDVPLRSASQEPLAAPVREALALRDALQPIVGITIKPGANQALGVEADNDAEWAAVVADLECVGAGLDRGATFVDDHRVEAAGLALGAASVATGFGAVVGVRVLEAIAVGSTELGSTSVATEAGSAAIDGSKCVSDVSATNLACDGAALGGAAAGGGGLLIDSGLLDAPEAAGDGLDLGAVGLGGGDLAVDAVRALVGSESCSEGSMQWDS